MTKLILTRGLPASGKTTYARTWLAEDPAGRGRANRDDIRAMLFAEPTYKHDQEQLVTHVQRAIVEGLLAAGRDVIIDDTNLRPKFVRAWRRFARAHDVDVFGLYDFHIDVDEAVLLDSLRDKPVGEDVIRGMAQKFLKRTANGGHVFLTIPDEADDDEPADRYVPDPALPRAIIVDIDGTVALKHPDRDIYDLTLVHTDLRNEPVIAAVQAAKRDGAKIVYCSGRNETARVETAQWIAENVEVPGELWMRAAGDQRKDSIVKRELFDAHIRNRYAVEYVIDDRQQVVDMWRALGLTVLQCAPGDF